MYTEMHQRALWGFPGGPMVKKVKVVQLTPTLCNPMDCKESPCNAEYTGSIPGLGRSYMLGTIKPTRHNY